MGAQEAKRGKFGARVYLMDTSAVLVLQTIKRGTADNAPYILDRRARFLKEKFVDISDDKGIADAIRAALHGRL